MCSLTLSIEAATPPTIPNSPYPPHRIVFLTACITVQFDFFYRPIVINEKYITPTSPFHFPYRRPAHYNHTRRWYPTTHARVNWVTFCGSFFLFAFFSFLYMPENVQPECTLHLNKLLCITTGDWPFILFVSIYKCLNKSEEKTAIFYTEHTTEPVRAGSFDGPADLFCFFASSSYFFYII